MYRILLATLLTASACVDQADLPLDDGREDSVAGKGLRVRPRNEIPMWPSDDPAAWAEPARVDGETTIVLTTDDAVVAEGDLLLVSGTTNDTFEISPWSGDRIAKLSISKPAGTTTALVFVLFDETGFASCKNARGESTVFESVAIDLRARLVHVDGRLTYALEECGIGEPTSDDGSWTLGAFPLAFSADGPLLGSHRYRMTAEIL